MKYVEESRKFIKNNELWGLYQKEGGTELNAWTGDNMTAYIVTLPANKMELFLWLESDRMSNPVMREFYTERDVVMEERRLRYENSPYGRYYEALSALLFEAHPYRIPTIGYMSDLHHLTRQDAFNHFKKFYAPNNAVLILVGDVKEAKVLQSVRDYFGGIPKGPAIEPLWTADPDPVGQKRLHVKKDVAPILELFFKTSALGQPDNFPLYIIEGVLNGKSGRLFKTLVRDKKLATDVSASYSAQKYESFFMLHADLMQGVAPEAVEKELWGALDKLKEEWISEHELKKVKNNLSAAQVNMMRSNEGLADRLAFYEIGGDWRMINTFLDGIKQVSREEVRTTAGRIFTETNSVVGLVIREKGSAQ
jgi:predicted Zn-dependent peptidase